VPTLLQLRTGRRAALAGQVSAYAKQPRTGPVTAGTNGLDGDEVGNPRVHGGPEKAIYAYAAANYPLWAADHPEHLAMLVPGAFGENLLIDGLDESTTCIGDRWRIGTALAEVCQPRQPCSTLARWFADPQMVKAMVANGRSGWYLRVREPGAMAAGDPLVLEARPNPDWPIARVLTASYRRPPDRAELAALGQLESLAAGWASWANRAATSSKPQPKPL
jgi:MOSC domain-containing protein YiiM